MDLSFVDNTVGQEMVFFLNHKCDKQYGNLSFEFSGDGSNYYKIKGFPDANNYLVEIVNPNYLTDSFYIKLVWRGSNIPNLKPSDCPIYNAEVYFRGPLTQTLSNEEEKTRGYYAKVSGTSFAAPIVAGAVATLLEVKEDLTIQEIQEILRVSSDQLKEGQYAIGGKNIDSNLIASGRILNIKEALIELARRYPTSFGITAPSPLQTVVQGRHIVASGTATADTFVTLTATRIVNSKTFTVTTQGKTDVSTGAYTVRLDIRQAHEIAAPSTTIPIGNINGTWNITIQEINKTYNTLSPASQPATISISLHMSSLINTARDGAINNSEKTNKTQIVSTQLVADVTFAYGIKKRTDNNVPNECIEDETEIKTASSTNGEWVSSVTAQTLDEGDGVYDICIVDTTVMGITPTDVKNRNSAFPLVVIRDTTAPTTTAMSLTAQIPFDNGDTYINAREKTHNTLLSLVSAPIFTDALGAPPTVQRYAILTQTDSCTIPLDVSIWGLKNIPKVGDIPTADDIYKVCALAYDVWENGATKESNIFTQDTTAPKIVYTNQNDLKEGTSIQALTPLLTETNKKTTGAFSIQSGILPVGLTLNKNTGIITGTPTTAKVSSTRVTIRVEDRAGNTGTTVITFPSIVAQPRSSISRSNSRSRSKSRGGGGGGGGGRVPTITSTPVSVIHKTFQTTIIVPAQTTKKSQTTLPQGVFPRPILPPPDQILYFNTSITQTLGQGSIKEKVKQLQQTLNTLGYVVATTGMGSKGQETTYFGPSTQNALLAFQRAHTLPQTGILDTTTRTLLNQKIKIQTTQTSSFNRAQLIILIQKILTILESRKTLISNN